MILVTMLLKIRMCQYVSSWSCHLHLQIRSFSAFLGISGVLLNLALALTFSFSFYLYITSSSNSCKFHLSKLFFPFPYIQWLIHLMGTWARPIASIGDLWRAISASEPPLGLAQSSAVTAFQFTFSLPTANFPLPSRYFWEPPSVKSLHKHFRVSVCFLGSPTKDISFSYGLLHPGWPLIISCLEYCKHFLTSFSTHGLPFYNQSIQL